MVGVLSGTVSGRIMARSSLAVRMAWQKRYREENREMINAKQRAAYKARSAEKRAYHKEYYIKNRAAKLAARRAFVEKHRERLLAERRKKDGLPAPLWPAPKLCEMCNQPSKHALCLDHDHETGFFRGWICSRCNRALGMLGDNLAGVMRAVKYLQNSELL
jgi:hypothetical protein